MKKIIQVDGCSIKTKKVYNIQIPRSWKLRKDLGAIPYGRVLKRHGTKCNASSWI